MMIIRKNEEDITRSNDDYSGMDLSGAYINGDAYGVSFVGANLREVTFGAKLKVASSSFDNCDFRGCKFDLHAEFVDCSFFCVNFDGVTFCDDSFEHCDFMGASFVGANFRHISTNNCCFGGASFKKADLYGANLEDWDLEGANLQPVWDDLFALLSLAPNDIPALEKAIWEGKIDGSMYSRNEADDCVCLNGTLSESVAVRGSGTTLKELVTARDYNRPIERFIRLIVPDETPDDCWRLREIIGKIQEFKATL